MKTPEVPSPGAYHQPALLRETLEAVRLGPGAVAVDATLGGGGHTRAMLAAVAPDGCVIGVDQDPEAIAEAETWSGSTPAHFTAVRANFEDLEEAVRDAGFEAVDAVLFDLGVSSHQLDAPERGFSFRAQGPLDMRMDPDEGESVAAILQHIREADLVAALREYGEERFAGRIARVILADRDRIAGTADLAELIRRVVPRTPDSERIHPATRTFQALRILANREMDVLPPGLRGAVSLLRPGGRIAVIAYHSLEDRIVKTVFREEAAGCICPPRMPICGCGRKARLRLVGSKPIRPTDAEVAANPRARSARLRVAERLPLTVA